MARLVYTTIMSLDGCIEDAGGSFDWAVPDEAVHAFVNDLERTIGTQLYGRRTYETMAIWQLVGPDAPAGSPPLPDGWVPTPVELAYAEIWRASDKVVFSTTLDAVSTPRTRLERAFDPVAIRRLIEGADRDVSISGPTLAEHAFAADLVDDVHVFVCPVAIGGGKPAFPRNRVVELDLLDVRRFDSGVVHLRYGRR